MSMCFLLDVKMCQKLCIPLVIVFIDLIVNLWPVPYLPSISHLPNWRFKSGGFADFFAQIHYPIGWMWGV